MSFGGYLWLIIDVVAVAVLAGALIYGGRMWRWRDQSRATRRASDAATRKLYSDEHAERRNRPPPTSPAGG